MKSAKKVLSLFLALIMILSCASTAYAAYPSDHLTQIYVEGFESEPIVLKDDPEKKSLLFPVDGAKLLDNLMKYENNIRKAIDGKDANLLRGYIGAWMDDSFGLTALSPDGRTNASELIECRTSSLRNDGNGRYVMSYDSRLDPIDLAKELKKYVDQVTGGKKYELVGSSYGSTIIVSYLNEYPEELPKIDSVVLCVPSANGVNFAGELFTGNFSLDADAIEAFVKSLDVDEDIYTLVSMLNKTGSLQAILKSALEPVLKAALVDALRDTIYNIFGTFPAMWTFVEDEFFYDALEFVYGADYASPDHEYAQLIEKVINYHENILVRTYDIISNAKNAGVHTNVIAKYGSAPIPVSKDGNFMGDGFVALERASFGATCGGNMKTLPEGYVQAKLNERNFISPDGCIDASTCLLPYNTWFIRGLWHGTKTSSYYELINHIIYNNMDIDSDANYPQFMQVDEDGETIIPMNEGNPAESEKKTSWIYDFLTLLPRLFNFIIDKIRGFFEK